MRGEVITNILKVSDLVVNKFVVNPLGSSPMDLVSGPGQGKMWYELRLFSIVTLAFEEPLWHFLTVLKKKKTVFQC